MSGPPHGGDLSRLPAAEAACWLDLSTGINPRPYPAADLAGSLARLPQQRDLDALLAAARRAYCVPEGATIVAAPGTQAIIQWLPHIVRPERVTVIGPTYAEHAHRWSKFAPVAVADALPDTGFAVVVNPNNPDGRRFAPDDLRAAAQRVTLVVDEAFGDLAPQETVAGAPGTIVLKSFGKFYGLAGVRLGFAIAEPAVAAALADALGPWAVSGPALSLGRAALADEAWAETTRATLARERAALDDALAQAGLTVVGGTDLFRLVSTPDAAALSATLAAHQIAVRRFPERADWVRIGAPGPHLSRLTHALADFARRRPALSQAV